jgi:hypothetical protein
MLTQRWGKALRLVQWPPGLPATPAGGGGESCRKRQTTNPHGTVLGAHGLAGADLYETYLNGVLVPGSGVSGHHTIAYCRDVGPTTVVLSGRHVREPVGTEHELNITC